MPRSWARPIWRVVAACGFSLLLAGCSPWIVIQQSGPPSALVGEQNVRLGFDYSHVNLGGFDEATFLSNKSPKERGAYREVKDTLNRAFFSAYNGRVDGVAIVTPNAEANVLTLTVTVLLLAQGKYLGVYTEPTQVIARCLWWKGEQRLDEIEVEVVIDASLTSPSIISRVDQAGAVAGQLCARYHNDVRSP